MLVTAAEGYARWAATWDETPSPIVALEQRLLAPILATLHPKRAIDVGCGTGRYSTQINALGFDLSPEMLAIAGSKANLQGRLAAANMMRLPVRDGAADLVLCALTLGHARDPIAALSELARILEPGGTLLLTDFHPAAAAQGWRRTFRHANTTFEIENHPYALSSTETLKLEQTIEAHIGEPERHLFDLAGRPELFEPAIRVPAVLLTRWTRP